MLPFPRSSSVAPCLGLALLLPAVACRLPAPGTDAGVPADTAATAVAIAPAPDTTRLLDVFDDVSAWTAAPSDGVQLRLSADGGYRGQGMRLDVDFQGGGGYAVARRTLPLDLPENYAFTFWIRGDLPANNLEFKLVDPSGDNVWWVNRRDFRVPERWTQVTIRRRQVEFAWGPRGGGDLRELAALELAITAGRGGRGTVWIDELALSPLEPVVPYTLTPQVIASSSAGGTAPAAALGGPGAWRSAADGAQWLALDFLRNREYGGLVVTWDSLDHATRYDVQTSPDGEQWTTVRSVERSDGGRDYLVLPESESRHLRLWLHESSRGRGYAVRALDVQPLEFGTQPNRVYEAIAADAPAGSYPKYFSGVQSYWTVVGLPNARREALMDAQGAIEVDVRGFSLEPFLWAGDSLLTWKDARLSQELAGDALPIPTVRRDHGATTLAITSWASGEPGAGTLWARYRVANRADTAQRVRLFVAMRPFQVNPTWQFLNTPGGVAEVPGVAYDGHVVTVRGVDSAQTVVPVTGPTAFGAATFDMGGVIASLRRGAVPAPRVVDDPVARASGVLSYQLQVPAGDSVDVVVAVPLAADSPVPAPNQALAAAAREAAASLAAARVAWSERLGAVEIDLPPAAERIERTLRSTVAYTLINQDGPAIQPGSRSYQRSWIRDGSLTSAALLRMGQTEAVRRFLEWYAPFQYPSGKVPCCVDWRGADPVPEHDSHGQLIYLIAEYYRYTGDSALVRRLWPHVELAVQYIDSLRLSRRTPVYDTPDSIAYRGLMPQSISHEGYSAKPMHSYWDNAFALKGLKDAVALADSLGHDEQARRWAAIRDRFRADLVASYRRAMALHDIDYLPGAVELGDFDATSTTVAVAPGGELASLPDTALRRTFERYWEEFQQRRSGAKAWEAYTPYELRTVGTFVRLGWKARAHEALDWFFGHQRPAPWHHWAEVVFRDPDAPKFIGDMPHTWVGSDFIRSVTDMLAYERDVDGALVLGAGIPEAWLVAGGEPVRVARLRTHYGPLSYTMERVDARTVRVRLASPELAVPAGGLVLRSPLAAPLRAVTVAGRAVTHEADQVVLHSADGEVLLRY